MTPQQYQQVKDLFHQWCERPTGDDADAFFASRRIDDEDVRSEAMVMIELDRRRAHTPGPLDHPSAEARIVNAVATAIDSPAAVPAPAFINGYRIIHLLGEGGMGCVYEAMQERPHRRVAIKVLRTGLATQRMLRRFELEVEMLGRLDHPGIARIYEASTFDAGLGPQPYFVMERVDGRPLLDYVRSTNPTQRKRLELLARLCDAVHYAHQRGIIHRDLKPENILVSEAPDATGSPGTAEPKVLDFGVARVVDSNLDALTRQTDAGQLIGTLATMSPEQLAGDSSQIDIRSDVYALGVIAYEVLCDHPPFDLRQSPLSDALRVLAESAPRPLGAVRSELRGDLETIVGKAMDRDKDRRYQSALDLAADIRRYLNQEPIAARPANTAYVLRKFARRHRPLVALAAAALVLLIGASLAMAWLTWRAHRAERVADDRRLAALDLQVEAETARDVAQREAEEASAINRVLELILRSPDPAFRGTDVRLLDVLAAADKHIASSRIQHPTVEAGVRDTVGRTYMALEMFDLAEPHFQRACDLRREHLGDEHTATLTSLQNLTSLYRKTDRPALAEPLQRRVYETHLRHRGERHAHTIIAAHSLAMILAELERFDESEPLYRQAIGHMRETMGDGSLATLQVTHSLGVQMLKQARFEEALQLLENICELAQQNLSPALWHVACFQGAYGACLSKVGRFDEAECELRSAFESLRTKLGLHHRQTQSVRDSLIELYEDTGRPADAEALRASSTDAVEVTVRQ